MAYCVSGNERRPDRGSSISTLQKSKKGEGTGLSQEVYCTGAQNESKLGFDMLVPVKHEMPTF